MTSDHTPHDDEEPSDEEPSDEEQTTKTLQMIQNASLAIIHGEEAISIVSDTVEMFLEMLFFW